METLLTYLLKSAALLSIFYLVYLLLLKNQTSFTENRKFLLGGIIASVVLPAVYFTRKVFVEANNLSMGEIPISTNATSEGLAPYWGTWEIVGIIYILVSAFFLIKIAVQLFNIYLLIRKSNISSVEGFSFIKTEAALNPFSFFKFIVYNPAAHSEKDLKMILLHEKIHASQWHSVDILIANLTTALLWFNPLSWYYKKSLEQNLEYIADRETVAISGAKKSYQQTLVKVSIPNLQPSLTNQFYQSFIKKRILMLNKQSTQNFSLIRISFVFPLILAFMLTFNVKTEASNISTENNKTLSTTSEEDQKLLEAHFSESTSKASLDNYQDAFAEKNVKLEWRNIEYSANSLKNIHITYTLETGDSREFQSETDEDGIMLPFKISAQFHENGKVAFIAIANKKPGEKAEKQLVEKEVDFSDKQLPENLVYQIDGKEVEKEVLDKLDPEMIAEIRVLKDEKAIEEVGEKGKNGVILVKTKQSQETAPQDKKQGAVEKTKVKIKKLEKKDVSPVPADSLIAFEPTKIEARKTGIRNPQPNIQSDRSMQPMVIVEGEEKDMEYLKTAIEPTDIKSMNVLKSAAAIEKYGEKAAGGAVEVKLKE